MEAEVKAAAAREAEEVAARQEVVAASLAISATQAHDEVMDVMALEVVVPDASNEIPRARRYCPSPTSIVLLQPDASNETPRAKRYSIACVNIKFAMHGHSTLLCFAQSLIS